MDTQRNNESESNPFETNQPEKDNPVHKEFEIGHLGNEQLKEDEQARDESGNDASRNTKPSQRKF